LRIFRKPTPRPMAPRMTNDQVISLLLIGATVAAFHLRAAYQARTVNLHDAVYHWNPALIEKLVSSGANVDTLDPEGRTPLHVAADIGNVYAARALLAHGAQPNAQDATGLTPLHIAVQDSELFVAKALLEYGAFATLPDGNGKTPLDLATDRIEEGNRNAALMVCLLQGVRPAIVR